ncbi:MAG TPA: hypothetical protein VFY73_10730 [Ideonella sp.]|uniref:hypothetical protein n=1 Tax=Ideonella sp. TaxID=1929293 RepID=UPI002E326152|nr:hypothetical protein [Ideonella sp.]HEX5684494.1 hypothetical protein [Ideonella sp.]
MTSHLTLSTAHSRRPGTRIVAVGALWLLAAAAPAQTIGHYQGTTSQGHFISINVVDDGAGGNAFGGGQVLWEANCTKSGPGRLVSWALGTFIPFSGKKFATEFRLNSLYEKWKLTFRGNSVSGTFLGRTPEFTDPATSTKSVQLCDSGLLSFTATLTAPLAGHALPAPGQALKLK